MRRDRHVEAIVHEDRGAGPTRDLQGGKRPLIELAGGRVLVAHLHQIHPPFESQPKDVVGIPSTSGRRPEEDEARRSELSEAVLHR
jgi:hypothetical protein